MRAGSLQPLRNLRAFGRAYGALLADLLATCRGRVAVVVVLSFAGIVLQVAALGVALYYVTELTAEESVAVQVPLLSGLDLPVSASAVGIAVWGFTILAMVVAAAGATYGAEVVGFTTARRYLRTRAERILASVATATEVPGGARRGETPTRHVQRMLGRNETIVLRALLLVQRSLRALLMVIVAAVVLALLNPVLTGIVAIVALVFTIPYYMVNRRLVEAATHLDDIGARSGQSVRRIVEAATTRQAHAVTEAYAPRLYRDDAAIERRWGTQGEILLARQRSAALLSALFGFSFVAILVTFSIFIAEGNGSWVVALTFLVALNVASAAFKELGTSITAANRFLPRVQDHLAFSSTQTRAPSASGRNGADLAGALPSLRAPKPTLPGSLTSVELGAQRIFCVCPERVDRLNLRAWLCRLSDDEHDGWALAEAAYFCGDSSGLPPVALREVLQLEHGDERRRAAFLALVADLGLTREFASFSGGFDTVMGADLQAGLSAEMRLLLALAPGIIGRSRLFVIGWRVIAPASRASRLRILGTLGEVPVLLFATRMGARQPPEASLSLVVDSGGIAGMGDAEWHFAVADRTADHEPELAPSLIALDDEESMEE